MICMDDVKVAVSLCITVLQESSNINLIWDIIPNGKHEETTRTLREVTERISLFRNQLYTHCSDRWAAQDYEGAALPGAIWSRGGVANRTWFVD
jgi:hypothetical protein